MGTLLDAVNAHAVASEQARRRAKEAARAARKADRRMLTAAVLYIAALVLVSVLGTCGHISEALAGVLWRGSTLVLAVWFGAWVQFRFCERGLLK